MDLTEFILRLAQTILWCQGRVDLSNPASCLRSPELRPRLLEENRFYTVSTVVNARDLRSDSRVREASIPDNFANGRLLLYFPNMDLACGAAEFETSGFFDVNNVPPWDTWVDYIQNDPGAAPYDSEYLIAWIPPEFVELADSGVNVNPEMCIQWLADTTVSLAVALRQDGFRYD